MYGNQREILGILRRNKLEVKITIQTNKILKEVWERCFENLYNKIKEQFEQLSEDENKDINITHGTIEWVLKSLKNRKCSRPHEISNELLKYARNELQKEILPYSEILYIKWKYLVTRKVARSSPFSRIVKTYSQEIIVELTCSIVHSRYSQSRY